MHHWGTIEDIDIPNLAVRAIQGKGEETTVPTHPQLAPMLIQHKLCTVHGAYLMSVYPEAKGEA